VAHLLAIAFQRISVDHRLFCPDCDPNASGTVIGAVGYVLNHSLSLIEKRLLAWRQKTIAQY
jgi:hypothetical protein